ncbi:MAG: sulfatase-like hydrolase/transferase [Armatimonadota bacterium]|nr:sulfatase-like hydrolase/transferase [Armatimonadota bacterium]
MGKQSCKMTRREFVVKGAAAIGTLTTGLSLSRPAFGEKRPNILFILTDDQRYDAMGFMGRPSFLKTPNLDRIAREGAHFENAFVTTALCSPSRASFLTGTYAHRHGVVNNEANDPDPSCPTFPLLLQKAGYETAYIGKWHMEPKADPRPGFDYWLSFKAQGIYENPNLNENGHEFQAEGYMTDLLTNYAVNWLKRKRSKPFCMILAHKAVHSPFTPAPRHKDAFPNAEIPEPASYKDTFEDKPEWMRRAFTFGVRRERWIASLKEPAPQKVERGEWNPREPRRLDYYRTILAIDESVGRVLDTLEKTGQLDNTVIVFASDNGFFMGEHGLGDKRLIYEESIRIPLLMRYPEIIKPGSKRKEMFLNIDLAPTLLDIAGVDIPKTMQGRSILPILKGKKSEWRESFLYEYFREEWAAGIPLMLGVRSKDWTYCSYPDMNDIEELYDLRNDPTQVRNLALDSAHLEKLQEMRAELERLKKETEYPEGKQLGAPPVGPIEEAKVIEGLVLSFDFARGDATDVSGHGNKGILHGGQFVEEGGRKVLKLEKGDYIDVSSSPALNPCMTPWTIEALIKGKEGVVIAQGGASFGYSLYLDGGIPRFALRSEETLTEIAGNNPIGNDWVRLTAAIRKHGIELYVDGKLVASTGNAGLLPAKPHEGLQIGMDTGSLVGSYSKSIPYSGLIEYVRIWAGEHKIE